MNNTLGNLNEILFEQMLRLNNKELKGEELIEEMGRSKLIGDIATKVIANGNLVLQAKKLADNSLDADLEIPKMLEG